MKESIKVPFTPEQVESLNGFQQTPHLHPWTCFMTNEDFKPICHAVLVATTDGLICPVDSSHGIRALTNEYLKMDYQTRRAKYKNGDIPSEIIPQGTWAHDFMVNNYWKEANLGDGLCGFCGHWHRNNAGDTDACAKCSPGEGCGQLHEKESHLGWGVGCPRCMPWPG
jgi:hypothetical protein